MTPSLRGFLSAWTGHGNIGDEIVHDVFFLSLRAVMNQLLDIPVRLTWDTKRPSRYDGPVSDRDYDFGILGGGSTIAPMYADKLISIVERKLPIFAHGSGYQYTGLEENSFFQIFDIVRQLDGGGLRGNKTVELLARKGVRPNVGLLADPGLIAPWVYDCDFGFIDDIFAQNGEKYVVINLLDRDSYFDYIVETAVHIITFLGFSILLVPFFDDDFSRHGAMMDAIKSRSGCSDKVRVVNTKIVPKLLGIYSRCEFSISFRLHSWILGISTGRPALGVGANLKYLDISDWVGHESMLLSDLEPLPPIDTLVKLLCSDESKVAARAVSRRASGEQRNHNLALAKFFARWTMLFRDCCEIEIAVENRFDGVPFRITGFG